MKGAPAKILPRAPNWSQPTFPDSNDTGVRVSFINMVLKSIFFYLKQTFTRVQLKNDSESIVCKFVMLLSKILGFELILLDIQIIRG